MTHLAFISLFLGLVFGPHDVEMKVTGPATRIELQVDGRAIGTIDKPPWKSVIDFGPHLLPHILVARALDADGNEVARAEQSINMPRDISELQLILERDINATPVAVHVLWRSLEADRPKDIFVSLDGRRLALDANNRAELPKVGLDTPHVLRGRAISPSGIPATADIAFGGGLEGETGAKLTPIAIRLRRKGEEPTKAELERALRIGATSAKVAAVEKLSPEIIIVRHPVRTEAAMRIDVRKRALPDVRRNTPDFKTAVFLWPVARTIESAMHATLFEWTGPVNFAGEEDLKTLLVQVAGPAETHLLFGRAVAVAGLRALSAREPRAVVFVMGEASRDDSGFTPEMAREYLRAIGVPLYVWSVGNSNTPDWGDAANITSLRGFHTAYEALTADLASQRIVWIEGDHLPADVASISHDIETLAATVRN